jgi:hypothetical protein
VQVGVPNDGEALLLVIAFVAPVFEDGLVRGMDECMEFRKFISPIPKCFLCLGMGRVILVALEEDVLDDDAIVVLLGSLGAINA